MTHEPVTQVAAGRCAVNLADGKSSRAVIASAMPAILWLLPPLVVPGVIFLPKPASTRCVFENHPMPIDRSGEQRADLATVPIGILAIFPPICAPSSRSATISLVFA
jgi:hypothetical protein